MKLVSSGSKGAITDMPTDETLYAGAGVTNKTVVKKKTGKPAGKTARKPARKAAAAQKVGKK